MKKIWITGAEGHIGTALLDLLEGVEYQLLPTDIEEVDITKIDEVTQFVHVNRPDVVINCAGLTDVQECENNVDEAYSVNAIGVRNVALAANEVNAKVIQISTDDVFDKESRVPYNEFDNVHPRTIYGKSKEAGEKILTQLLNRFVIIRSSWIYGIGRDFVDEVLRNVGQGKTMEVPNNQYAAPTSAKELAKVIRYFIDNEEYMTCVVGGAVATFANIPLMCLFGAMVNNCVEYNDYKFGKRIVGMTNSANSFGMKIGSGIGASLIGWLLAAAGYNAALAAQPASVDTAIFTFGIYIPLALFVIMFILLLKNDLEKRYPEIVAELQKRKEAK